MHVGEALYKMACRTVPGPWIIHVLSIVGDALVKMTCQTVPGPSYSFIMLYLLVKSAYDPNFS